MTWYFIDPPLRGFSGIRSGDGLILSLGLAARNIPGASSPHKARMCLTLPTAYTDPGGWNRNAYPEREMLDSRSSWTLCKEV